MPKVFLDVGHGGADPSAIARDKQKEKDLNLSIDKACGAYLERHGVQVRFSRTRDEHDPVEQEVAECNSFATYLAVIVECAFVIGKCVGIGTYRIEVTA